MTDIAIAWAVWSWIVVMFAAGFVGRQGGNANGRTRGNNRASRVWMSADNSRQQNDEVDAESDDSAEL